MILNRIEVFYGTTVRRLRLVNLNLINPILASYLPRFKLARTKHAYLKLTSHKSNYGLHSALRLGDNQRDQYSKKRTILHSMPPINVFNSANRERRGFTSDPAQTFLLTPSNWRTPAEESTGQSLFSLFFGGMLDTLHDCAR